MRTWQGQLVLPNKLLLMESRQSEGGWCVVCWLHASHCQHFLPPFSIWHTFACVWMYYVRTFELCAATAAAMLSHTHMASIVSLCVCERELLLLVAGPSLLSLLDQSRSVPLWRGMKLTSPWRGLGPWYWPMLVGPALGSGIGKIGRYHFTVCLCMHSEETWIVTWPTNPGLEPCPPSSFNSIPGLVSFFYCCSHNGILCSF